MILNGRTLKPADFKRIGEVVEGGGIIGFPTDTVYGLGCNAFNASAIDRVYAVKKRKETKPLVMFVSGKGLVMKYSSPNTVAKNLIDEFFPGPLTVLVQRSSSSPGFLVGSDGKIGVRIPDNEIILGVLDAVGTPLATTSANPSGKEESTTAEMVASLFVDERIEIVIDGGMCDRAPSAVIDSTTTPPTLLRKGGIAIPKIENALGHNIELGKGVDLVVLFVCTGNTCRSPMASGLLRKRLGDAARNRIRIISAGTSASSGSPPTEFATGVAENHGIDIFLYRSRPLTKEILQKADFIIGFEPAHLRDVSRLLPGACSKSFLLKGFKDEVSPVDSSIGDPSGGGWEVYRKCMDEIMESMDLVIDYFEKKFE